jgi:hypothetical protein
MTPKENHKLGLHLRIEASANGRIGKASVVVLDAEGRTVACDRGDLNDARELQKLAGRLAGKLDVDSNRLGRKLEAEWHRVLDRLRVQQQEDEERRQELEKQNAEDQPAESVDDRAERLLREMPPQVRQDAKAYLRDPNLVERISDDIEHLGVAGEKRLALSLYLVGTSRLLDRPLGAIIKGPTASGKSFVINEVARLMPPEAVLIATALTPQSLYYMEQGTLKHRWIVAGERSRNTKEDEVADATKALREMIASGRLSKLIPIKGEAGMTTVLIEQEGPIAYSETTTRERIFAEDENRLLSLHTDERPEQTRRVITRLAHDATGAEQMVDTQRIMLRHHAVQRLLRRRQIVIPYAERLGELIQDERVEARRAFPHLVSMIRTSTLLHQFQRKSDMRGQLIATPDDYALARKLIHGSLTRLLGCGNSPAARRFYERLRKWKLHERFTTTEARQFEKHSKPTVWEWLRELAEAGLLRVVEDGRGRKPAVWEIVPESVADVRSVLPSVETLACSPGENT